MKTIQVGGKELELPYSVTIHLSEGAYEKLRQQLSITKLTGNLLVGLDDSHTVFAAIMACFEKEISEITFIQSDKQVRFVLPEEDYEKLKPEEKKKKEEPKKIP